MYFNSILTGLVNLILFGFIALLRRLIHKEGIKSFLWPSDTIGRPLLWEGFVVGMVSFGLYSTLAVMLGQGALTLSGESLYETVASTAVFGFGFFGVALFEEGLFRGYFLQKLLKRFSALIAIGISAVIFGAFHLFSYSSSQTLWLGILNASLIGIVLSVGVIKSRSLMWAIGFHWAWNLTGAVLLAEQDYDHRVAINLHTNDGLWAGSGMAESGLIVTLILIGLWLYISWRFRFAVEGAARVQPEKQSGL